MTFQPVVPFGGTAGWAFLQRTQAAQREAFETSSLIQRDVDYFSKNIAKVETAADLVGDYRLMKVALGAFGLDDDLPNKAFIQKVLEEGSLDPDSFANRMIDKRYLALTETFGLDLAPPNTQLSDFADSLIDQYKTRQFEIAVGGQNADMRLLLGLERDLGAIVASENTDNGRWYGVLGNEPLRRVFETALGLPPETAALDIDRQVEVFREKSDTILGQAEVSGFADGEAMEALSRMFLVRAELSAGASGLSPGSIALTLLQNRR